MTQYDAGVTHRPLAAIKLFTPRGSLPLHYQVKWGCGPDPGLRYLLCEFTQVVVPRPQLNP